MAETLAQVVAVLHRERDQLHAQARMSFPYDPVTISVGLKILSSAPDRAENAEKVCLAEIGLGELELSNGVIVSEYQVGGTTGQLSGKTAVDRGKVGRHFQGLPLGPFVPRDAEKKVVPFPLFFLPVLSRQGRRALCTDRQPLYSVCFYYIKIRGFFEVPPRGDGCPGWSLILRSTGTPVPPRRPTRRSLKT